MTHHFGFPSLKKRIEKYFVNITWLVIDNNQKALENIVVGGSFAIARAVYSLFSPFSPSLPLALRALGLQAHSRSRLWRAEVVITPIPMSKQKIPEALRHLGFLLWHLFRMHNMCCTANLDAAVEKSIKSRGFQFMEQFHVHPNRCQLF